MANTPFAKKLMAWYGKNARDLPWRKTRDPYKIWISEVMLQQTTVKAVIPYYERWIKRFPTVSSVSKASLEEILRAWQGLGYYSRARNIHAAAKIIVKEFNGKIPDSQEKLKTLPGFGPYTIGAVLSIAYDKRISIIDANVRRVLMRQLAIRGKADTVHDQKISHFLNAALPFKNISTFNQALMELGALVCRNQDILCSLCPVKTSCRAFRLGIQEIIPQPKQNRLLDLSVAVAIIKRKGKYLIQKRPSKGLLANLWEFPGGKVEKGESVFSALKREVREELRAEVLNFEHLSNFAHFYTRFRVKLHVFCCELKSKPSPIQPHKWVSAQDFSLYPMPSGSVKIANRLANLNNKA